jgi:hypothetical protein
VVVTSTWRPGSPQAVLSQPTFLALAVPVLSTAAIAVARAYAARPEIRPMVLTPSPLSHECDTFRPGTGTTLRPGGTTVRPTGSTARPGSGLTLRPDTGDTDNPC